MALVFLMSLAYGYGGYRAKEDILSGVVSGHTQELKDLTDEVVKLRIAVTRLDARIERSEK